MFSYRICSLIIECVLFRLDTFSKLCVCVCVCVWTRATVSNFNTPLLGLPSGLDSDLGMLSKRMDSKIKTLDYYSVMKGIGAGKYKRVLHTLADYISALRDGCGEVDQFKDLLRVCLVSKCGFLTPSVQNFLLTADWWVWSVQEAQIEPARAAGDVDPATPATLIPQEVASSTPDARFQQANAKFSEAHMQFSVARGELDSLERSRAHIAGALGVEELGDLMAEVVGFTSEPETQLVLRDAPEPVPGGHIHPTVGEALGEEVAARARGLVNAVRDTVDDISSVLKVDHSTFQAWLNGSLRSLPDQQDEVTLRVLERFPDILNSLQSQCQVPCTPTEEDETGAKYQERIRALEEQIKADAARYSTSLLRQEREFDAQCEQLREQLSEKAREVTSLQTESRGLKEFSGVQQQEIAWLTKEDEIHRSELDEYDATMSGYEQEVRRLRRQLHAVEVDVDHLNELSNEQRKQLGRGMRHVGCPTLVDLGDKAMAYMACNGPCKAMKLKEDFSCSQRAANSSVRKCKSCAGSGQLGAGLTGGGGGYGGGGGGGGGYGGGGYGGGRGGYGRGGGGP